MTKKMDKTDNTDSDVKLDRQEDLSAELRTKLKSCDLDVQNFVAELEAENLKLHRQIAKYQAQEVSLNNRIKALKENRDEEDRLSISNLMKTISNNNRSLVKEDGLPVSGPIIEK